MAITPFGAWSGTKLYISRTCGHAHVPTKKHSKLQSKTAEYRLLGGVCSWEQIGFVVCWAKRGNEFSTSRGVVLARPLGIRTPYRIDMLRGVWRPKKPSECLMKARDLSLRVPSDFAVVFG